MPAYPSFMPMLTVPAVICGCGLLAYLFGSIPFGLILGKLGGVGDIRNIGSGNIGATNMLRTGNKNLAAATLLLDMAKGFFAVMICGIIIDSFMHEQVTSGSITLNAGHFIYFAGLCAVCGHVWPVWLNFKGGKGVATAIGVFLGAEPIVGGFAIACWLAVFFLTRYSSLSAIISIGLAPVIGYLFINSDFGFIALVIAVIVIAKHHANIKRLLNKTETKWRKS